MSQPTSWLAEIRQRLAEPPPRRLPPGEGRQAAVLVPLYVAAGELWVLFVERSPEAPVHQGQIAFPGGGAETGEEPWVTALREAGEELALPAAQALRLGDLDELASPTGFCIVPCVAAVPGPDVFTPRPAAAEVREAFGIPLAALANPTLVEERAVVVNGRTFTYPLLHVGRRRIWGVTAEIVLDLLRRLGLA